MRKIILSLLVLFFFVSEAKGHSVPFIELNPDKSTPLNIAELETPFEIFLPQNDFLGGFDFWIDNIGQSGPITFYLVDQNNNPLLSKTVVIPYINATEGGERFHLDFNSQIPVSSSNKYGIKIVSTLTDLRLYHANRINFLEHNAPYVSEFIKGVARLGSEDQDFSFKFALYENKESLPPVIKNIKTFTLSLKQVRLDFNANEPVDFKIDYNSFGQDDNQTINFNGAYQFCTEGVAVCSLVLNVNPDTNYQYLLTVKDVWGNLYKINGSFSSGQSVTMVSPQSGQEPLVTPAIPSPFADLSPPTISNLRLASVTDHSVGIAWETNEAADSFLLISFSQELITIAATNDNTFELEHLLKVDNVLNPDTPYLATIISRDDDNNVASSTISFTTLKLSKPLSLPNPLPSISPQPNFVPSQTLVNQKNIKIKISSEPGEKDERIITWELPQSSESPEGYRVDIFDIHNNLKHKILVASGVYQITVSGLEDGKYKVIVYANRQGVFEKIAPLKNFKIDRRSKTEKFFIALIKYWPILIIGLSVLLIIWKIIKKKTIEKALS